MYLTGEWFENGCPNRADHYAGIDVLVRPPTLADIFGADVEIGGLQRFDYGHKESRWFGLVCLVIEIAESTDHIDPIYRAAISMLMIAAIQGDLQLIPGCRKILVVQRAASAAGRSIRDIGR